MQSLAFSPCSVDDLSLEREGVALRPTAMGQARLGSD